MLPLSLFYALTVYLLPAVLADTMDTRYYKNRAQILANEKQKAPGGSMQLNEQERDMDTFIKALKQKEYYNFNEDDFLPAHDFLTVRDNITRSNLYSVLKAMPKGSSLHTHILAAANAEFIVKNLSYIDNLYMYQWNGRFKLKFMNETTARILNDEDPSANCRSVADARKDDKDFDAWLLRQLTITVETSTKSARWSKLSAIISTLYDMLTYRPVFEKYLQHVLTELLDERILYAELRGTFMEFYELDGRVYDFMESLGIMASVINAFQANNTDFIAAKYIYSPYRIQDNVSFHEHMKLLKEAHRKYPQLVVGFDLVGLEDVGGFLITHVEELQRVHKSIKFYFHAGETNWHGTSTDLNILDAILLGSSRIGHGLSLIKHPEMLQIVRDRRIAIEVAPVSNQVLKYVADLRNHPAVAYAAYGIPLIVCNDDPTAFGNTGLTYDFYLTFMAMSNVDAGLEFLKSTSLNSIAYSAMHSAEKQRAFQLFDRQWNEFTSMLMALKTILFKFMFRAST